ncbi:MAG: phosphoenolpyruvate--protein phosphotransferase [Spirochaetes bacterium]|nr:phosphoenolpyruvate--protein phosphotransferase [Spirochaetota bacterium]
MFGKFKGISASQGIAIGRAFILKHEKICISDEVISEINIGKEIERFYKGRERAEFQLQELRQKAEISLGKNNAEIFEGHIEILLDNSIEDDVKSLIENRRFSAEKAIKQVINENVTVMEDLDNPYMRERAADIKDIGQRLLYATANVELTSLADLNEKMVVFAADLTPSDTAQMDKSKILGFITETGGVTSHVAIMAQSMEIPAVVGTGRIVDQVKNSDMVILDASMGEIIINPTDEQITEYKDKMHLLELSLLELAKLKNLPAETIDGRRVELCANIGSDQEVDNALKHGAEGIGLYRTEFLFMDKPQMPTEEEQFRAYRKVAEEMTGKAVIIRTMDIGGDKDLSYLKIPFEQNPFLGWRAIRMCLDSPDILYVQLRAILRASHYGKIRIMYPMIISVSEIRALNEILNNVKQTLRDDGIPFDENIATGIMIETPASAIIAKQLIKEVDFFSIGTNDLTQYTLAVDRGNERIAKLYQPFHPAVLSLISQVIQASHEAGKWTGMCGELAGNEQAALLLAGMGLDEFSMTPSSIGKIKKIIRMSRYSDLTALSEKVLDLSNSEEVIAVLNDVLKKYR